MKNHKKIKFNSKTQLALFYSKGENAYHTLLEGRELNYA